MDKQQQPDLFNTDAEQIKQHHLARLRQLREEFMAKINQRKGETK